MFLSIQDIVNEAVEKALEAAQRQVEKQRPIENINARAIARTFVEDKMTHIAGTDTRKLYFLTAIVESDDDMDETVELDEIVRRLKSGYSCGHDASEEGRYVFEVHTMTR